MKKIVLKESELVKLIKGVISEKKATKKLITEACPGGCAQDGVVCDGSDYEGGKGCSGVSKTKTIWWMGCTICSCYCSNEVPGPGKFDTGDEQMDIDMHKEA